MPRKHIETSGILPYHICARSNNQDWFDVPISQIYDIYARVAKKVCEMYNLKIHAFVLMSNHFHMLVTTPDNNISASMRYFMTETSRAIARASRRINRIYGSRYHWTIIRSTEHYAHVYRYIYRNPVKAKVVDKVENYKWSTINNWHKLFSSLISENENGFIEYIPTAPEEALKWLNFDCGEEYEHSIQQALKRHSFDFPRSPTTGKKPNHFEHLIYNESSVHLNKSCK